MRILPFITFIFGAALGGAASYIATCNSYKKKMAEVDELYKEQLKKVKEECENKISTITPSTVEETEEPVKFVNPNDFDRNAVKINKTDYSKPVEQSSEIIFDPEAEAEMAIENFEKMNNIYAQAGVNRDEYPHLITDAEAASSMGYETVGINYYIQDGVCTYEDSDIPLDSIVDDECLTIDSLIGRENLRAFDVFINETTLYVKNEDTHQIFEICKIDGPSPMTLMHSGEDKTEIFY